MSDKELLIQYLKDLISMLELNDSDDEALSRLRRYALLPLFYDERIEHRIARIEEKIDTLLERPMASCRLGTETGDDSLKIMTGRGASARKEAIEKLADYLSGAEQLTVCDAFFLSNTKHHYIDEIRNVLPKTITSIELFVAPKKCDKGVAKQFNDLCKEQNIDLKCIETAEVHDRVWIVDWKRAFSVGTSFNGLGNKLAFILELPDDDRHTFIAELNSIRTRAKRCSEA